MLAGGGSGSVPVVKVAIFYIRNYTIFIRATIGGGAVLISGVDLRRVVNRGGAIGDIGGGGEFAILGNIRIIGGEGDATIEGKITRHPAVAIGHMGDRIPF